jgi:tetratricopeptide (TPR) repeat protein/DNA-binding SARP family transcriptional activator
MVEFRILGPVQLRAGDKQFNLRSRKDRYVLALLLWGQGQPIPSYTLIDKVWEGHQPSKSSLYSIVSRLRASIQQAGGDAQGIRLRRSGSSGSYALDVAPGDVDFRRFRMLCEQARLAVTSGDPARAVSLLDEADGLWQGTPLAGLSGTWADTVRTRLHEERFAATIARLDAELLLGHHAAVVAELFDLAAQHPLNQEPTRLLMLALYGSWRKPDALRVYRDFQRRLRDEEGSDPTPELAGLHQRMLEDDLGRAAAWSASQPGPLSVPRPVPPESTASTLPRDNPDFTGRVAELGTLAAWLHSVQGRSTVPVIVISGLAGTGKTTLAVHAAHLLGGQYPRKVYLDLCGHNAHAQPADPRTALAVALRTLGIPDGKIPESAEERAMMWRSRARGVLVVLDDARSAEQVLPLLPSTPGCAVVITTRYRGLNISGKLALPLGTLPPADATALFTRVAGIDQGTDPAAVSEVLGLCGHLPIEIEIAATQLRHRPTWTLSDLITRLRDIQAEDRRISASLELSYRCLMPEWQRLLRRLALHPPGGFSGYAAAALAVGSRPAGTRRALDGLVDHHLLEEPASGRYAFHDLVHEYARHLAETSDPEAERQQAVRTLLGYYLLLAEQADRVAHPFRRRLPVPDRMTIADGTRAPPELPALRSRQDCKKRMDAERQSLLRAARYAAAHGYPGHAALLPHFLAGFLDTWGDWTEAVDLHRLAAQAWHEAGNAAGEARARTDLCFILGRMGRYDEAITQAQAAIALARPASNKDDEASALSVMGLILWQQARYPQALVCLDEALGIWRSLDDRHGEADALCRGAIVLWHLRRPADALRQAEQALVIYRELGDPQGETNSLNNLGDMQRAMGRYEQALANYRAALGMVNDIGNRQGKAVALSNIGDVYRHAGDLAEAVKHYRTALREFLAIGDRRSEAEVLISMGETFRQAGDHPAAISQLQKALVLAHDLAEKYLQALSCLGIGTVHLETGDWGEAADDFRTALELSRQIKDPETEARAGQGLEAALAHLPEGQ